MHTPFLIHKSVLADIDDIMAVYDTARMFMRSCGNMSQWPVGYPSPGTIHADIALGRHFTMRHDGLIAGVFTFAIGHDPTYADIDGQWISDSPYGTIHRLASARLQPGVADACLEFCRSFGLDIRIDTHADNHPMLSWIQTRGFVRCGIIRVADGSPRTAFLLPRI